MKDRKKEKDEERQGTSKYYSYPTNWDFDSLDQWLSALWMMCICRCLHRTMDCSISKNCHLHYIDILPQTNLDFPRESVLKFLSKVKLQAKLDRLTKSMSSYYCDSEDILQGSALPMPKDRCGHGFILVGHCNRAPSKGTRQGWRTDAIARFVASNTRYTTLKSTDWLLFFFITWRNHSILAAANKAKEPSSE